MDKLLLRPMEAAELIGVGRSKIYELLANGTIPSVRIDKSVRVPAIALKEWVERKLAEQSSE